MSGPIDLTHGARWWKFDFHAHTPHSTDWQKHMPADPIDKPEDWLRRYMESGIDCVAVTDHNGGDYVDVLKAAYVKLADGESPPTWFRPLTLFPGVEISVEGGFHLLAIFDPHEGTAKINDLLAKVDYAGNKGSAELRTELSLLKVVRQVDQMGGIAIPAHVDEGHGMLQTGADTTRCQADSGTIRAVLESGHVFALEVCTMPEVLPRPADGLCDAWPCVIGTDWHHWNGQPDREPGQRYTWVKMGTPDLEGLRLALHVGHPGSIRRFDEVTTDPNQPPKLYLTDLTVSQAFYAGRNPQEPLTVAFSPWLTAIIGGRGSGKSTVVQAVRLLLNRGAELEELSEDLHDDFERFAKKGTGGGDGALTGDTRITLRCVKEGQTFDLDWVYGSRHAEVFAVDPEGGREEAPGTTASFPVRLFSQKQIYALASKPSGLLGLIDQTPEVDLPGWKTRWTEATSRYKAFRAEARAERAKLEEKPKLELERRELTRQIKTLETGENKAILTDHQMFVRQGRLLEDRRAELDEAMRAAAEFLDEEGPSNLPGDGYKRDTDEAEECFDLLTRAHRIHEDFLADVQKATEVFATRIEQWDAERAESAWTAARAASDAAYAALVQKLTDEKIADPTQHQKLVQQRQIADMKLKKLATAEELAAELDGKAEAQRQVILDLRRELTAKRRTFVAQLDESDHVRIKVLGYGSDPAAAEDRFRDAIDKQDDKLASTIYDPERSDSLLMKLYDDEGLANAPEVRDAELERRIEELREMCLTAADGGESEMGGHMTNHLKKLSAEQRDRLSLWFPSDDVAVEYRTPNRRWQPIRRASAGQKSAAVLAFILSYGDEPLILDQPEDDLDNHLIYHLIVKELTRTKRNRQVIVVTHNPNIVVNGDAELVNAMQFSSGQIVRTQSGCLQDAGVREEVCEVMEGGREAFDRRYRRVVERIDPRTGARS